MLLPRVFYSRVFYPWYEYSLKNSADCWLSVTRLVFVSIHYHFRWTMFFAQFSYVPFDFWWMDWHFSRSYFISSFFFLSLFRFPSEGSESSLTIFKLYTFIWYGMFILSLFLKFIQFFLSFLTHSYHYQEFNGPLPYSKRRKYTLAQCVMCFFRVFHIRKNFTCLSDNYDNACFSYHLAFSVSFLSGHIGSVLKAIINVFFFFSCLFLSSYMLFSRTA